MAAPTTAALVKKVLANPEPSTHGPTGRLLRADHRLRGIADTAGLNSLPRCVAIDPQET